MQKSRRLFYRKMMHTVNKYGISAHKKGKELTENQIIIVD